MAPRRDSLITRLARRVLVAIAITGAAGLLTAAIGFSFLETRLPDVSSFQSYLQTAREHSRVRAAGGEIVARFGPEVRTVVPIEQIPNT